MECVMSDMSNATDLMKNVMQTTQDYNAKVMQFAAANCNATLQYLTSIASAKTPSEFMELTTRHVREQAETLTRQARELTEMTQKFLPKAGQGKGFSS
jgi:phasin family protein